MTLSRSALKAPPPDSYARFAPEFGQRVLLTVDTEEGFDWDAPFQRDGYSLDHVPRIRRFQEFCEQLGVVPLYLVDWPIANDQQAVEIIGEALRCGTAEVGVQLHPWVNPPFDEKLNAHNSYAGNLPGELETAKFMALRDRIEERFGKPPISYRAGRYGLGSNTSALLRQAGIAIDTSVRSLFDYSAQSGPDYSGHPLMPYWLDDDRSLLELPVTSVYWGLLRNQGQMLHRLQRHIPTLFTILPKLGLLERIALTPEGVTVEEALRGIDIALDEGLPLLVLSFHSPTLAPGNTSYAANEAEVEALYDWFERVYAYLDKRSVLPVTAAEVLASAK